MSWATYEILSRVNSRKQEAIVSLLELQEKGADVKGKKNRAKMAAHVAPQV